MVGKIIQLPVGQSPFLLQQALALLRRAVIPQFHAEQKEQHRQNQRMEHTGHGAKSRESSCVFQKHRHPARIGYHPEIGAADGMPRLFRPGLPLRGRKCFVIHAHHFFLPFSFQNGEKEHLGYAGNPVMQDGIYGGNHKQDTAAGQDPCQQMIQAMPSLDLIQNYFRETYCGQRQEHLHPASQKRQQDAPRPE